MKLNYTFKHLDHSDSLVEYTSTKVSEIETFLLKEGTGNVYYWKQKNEFYVEVSCNTRQKYFKASAHGPDVYAAVDAVMEKLEKQFLKVHDQYKSHKKPKLAKENRYQAILWKKAA
jgi:putative sigma-54 modulation protein